MTMTAEVKRLSRLIGSVVRNFRIAGYELEDLFQEGFVVAWPVRDRPDSYIRVAVRHRMLMLKRALRPMEVEAEELEPWHGSVEPKEPLVLSRAPSQRMEQVLQAMLAADFVMTDAARALGWTLRRTRLAWQDVRLWLASLYGDGSFGGGTNA